MQPMTFTEYDIDVLLGALHNHAVKGRIKPLDAFELQKKLLSLIGKEMPITLEEAKEIARTIR